MKATRWLAALATTTAIFGAMPACAASARLGGFISASESNVGISGAKRN